MNDTKVAIATQLLLLVLLLATVAHNRATRQIYACDGDDVTAWDLGRFSINAYASSGMPEDRHSFMTPSKTSLGKLTLASKARPHMVTAEDTEPAVTYPRTMHLK